MYKRQPVDPFTYQSTVHPEIHVIGDSTDATTVGKVPKSGFIANSMGKVCGLAIIAELYAMKKLPPSMINTCFSLVSSEEGISVSAVYHYDESIKKIAVVKGASGLSPKSSSIIKDNAWDWANAIWNDMLT